MHGKNVDKNYQYIFVIVAVINLFQILAIFFYFPLVTENLIFTFSDLQPSDIPFYNGNDESTDTDRYRFDWWVFAFDILRFVPPLLAFMEIITEDIFKYHNPLPYIIIDALIAVIETLKLFYFLIRWIGCSNYQLCRGFNSSSSSPSSANYVFLSVVFFCMFFWITSIIYAVLSSEIAKGAKKKYNVVS